MAINNFLIITILVAIIQATMCSNLPSAMSFFEEKIKGNLTKITWAHAVNSQVKLNQTLANGDVMMIEGDVVLGKLSEKDVNKTAIMAHPPAVISNLSLEMFLLDILKDGKRGVKLDFKDIDGFEASLDIIKKYRENMTFPVWLNADILPGPVNAQTKPVDAEKFLKSTNEILPDGVLSVGWTTFYGDKNNVTSGNYSQQNIQSMLDTLSKNNVSQTITYPVRAGLAMNNITLLSELLTKTSNLNSTLTIWSSETDQDSVDAKALSTLIKTIGIDKVYLDVPDDLRKKIDISAATTVTSTSTSMLLIGTVITSYLMSKSY